MMVNKPKHTEADSDSENGDANHSTAEDSEFDETIDTEPQDVQTYFFGCKLTAEEPEDTWDHSSSSNTTHESTGLEDDDDAMTHVLRLRNVCLGLDAKQGDRNIVEVEATGSDGETIVLVVASLSVGVQEMGQIYLDFDGDVPVTLRLISGSGPIHVTGIHETTLSYTLGDKFNRTVDTVEAEEEEEADEVSEEEEVGEVQLQRKALKRKTYCVVPSTQGILKANKKQRSDNAEVSRTPILEEEEDDDMEEEEEAGLEDETSKAVKLQTKVMKQRSSPAAATKQKVKRKRVSIKKSKVSHV